jgi:hypothetical protein
MIHEHSFYPQTGVVSSANLTIFEVIIAGGADHLLWATCENKEGLPGGQPFFQVVMHTAG